MGEVVLAVAAVVAACDPLAVVLVRDSNDTSCFSSSYNSLRSSNKSYRPSILIVIVMWKSDNRGMSDVRVTDRIELSWLSKF